MDKKLKIVEGVWRCPSCGAMHDWGLNKPMPEDADAWRMVDNRYEHHCPGMPPQYGHFPCEKIN